MRRTCVTLVVLGAVLAVVRLDAQSYRIHNIALLDLDAVVAAFYADTAEIREYRRLSSTTKAELSAYDEQIRQTDLSRTQAVSSGDSRLAEELLGKLGRLQTDRTVLAEARKRVLRQLLASLSRQATYEAIVGAVESVAWEKGFSHVRAIDDDDVWWSPEIDITQAVIDALRVGGGR